MDLTEKKKLNSIMDFFILSIPTQQQSYLNEHVVIYLSVPLKYDCELGQGPFGLSIWQFGNLAAK